MIRRPFKITTARGAQARRPGGRPGGLGGRCSFVWLYGVLLPMADGHDGIEIRLSNGPWHPIRSDAQAALDEIQHYRFQRASLTKGVQARRARRGLPPLDVNPPAR